MKLTVCEVCICITKDKIYRSFYVAILNLNSGSCSVKVQRILTSDETAVFQINSVRRRSKCNGRRLLSLARMINYIIAVLESDTLCAEPCCVSCQQNSSALISTKIVFILGLECPVRSERIR